MDLAQVCLPLQMGCSMFDSDKYKIVDYNKNPFLVKKGFLVKVNMLIFFPPYSLELPIGQILQRLNNLISQPSLLR